MPSELERALKTSQTPNFGGIESKLYGALECVPEAELKLLQPRLDLFTEESLVLRQMFFGLILLKPTGRVSIPRAEFQLRAKAYFELLASTGIQAFGFCADVGDSSYRTVETMLEEAYLEHVVDDFNHLVVTRERDWQRVYDETLFEALMKSAVEDREVEIANRVAERVCNTPLSLLNIEV